LFLRACNIICQRPSSKTDVDINAEGLSVLSDSACNIGAEEPVAMQVDAGAPVTDGDSDYD